MGGPINPPAVAEARPNAGPAADGPLESLRGVGGARARLLRELGVESLDDLLEYFPRTYQFESSERAISRLVPRDVQIARGTVIAVDYVPARPRPRFQATLDDGTGTLQLVWFYGAYLRKRICPGQTLRVQGATANFRGQPQMINPRWAPVQPDAPTIEQEKLRPIYPASYRMPTEVIGQIIEEHLDAALAHVSEWFGGALLQKRGLMARREAYRAVHRPVNQPDADAARRRLVYDELMLMQLGLGINKSLRDGPLNAPAMRVDRLLDGRIRRRFPFELTDAQTRAVHQIVADLKRPRPMNRLLQGDVGSGKTVVALYAILVAIANKFQAVLLAPTEVLAEQHYLTISNMLRDSKVRIGLFTGRTRKLRKTRNAALAAGRIHLAIGTQALLEKSVAFANLGLVVVDEQHKLGVRQRAALAAEKKLCPHYLVMTATPIPRTLALSYFADFDITTIDRLPPGRSPIQTRHLRGAQAGEAYVLLRQQVAAGHQGYIVLPQIDDDGSDAAKSVRKEFERLGRGPLAGLRLAMLHGRLDVEEKQRTMAAFRDGLVDVLVATTVIEVGIDVPNATVMIIDAADRFGLSQLHQLRGRVGRGSVVSHCLLLADPTTPDADARLATMAHTGDGFQIAELDLRLRGPGEFFGTRQHGLPQFRIAEPAKEILLLQLARDDAASILAADPLLSRAENRALRAALIRRFGDTLPLARVG